MPRATGDIFLLEITYQKTACCDEIVIFLLKYEELSLTTLCEVDIRLSNLEYVHWSLQEIEGMKMVAIVRDKISDPDVTWTRNLLIWSQTRYHCATGPWLRVVTYCHTNKRINGWAVHLHIFVKLLVTTSFITTATKDATWFCARWMIGARLNVNHYMQYGFFADIRG